VSIDDACRRINIGRTKLKQRCVACPEVWAALLNSRRSTTQGKRRFAVGGVMGNIDIAVAPDWLLARLRPRLLGINALPPSSERVGFKTKIIDVK
jgi:hypothetical protein